MILYIQEQNTIIHQRDEGLEVRQSGALLYRVPLVGLERLVVMGNPQITTQALHALANMGIDVLYTTRMGKPSFALHAPKSDNVFLRLSQTQCFLDKEYSLQCAKNIVQSKLNSQINTIRRHTWKTDFNWQTRIHAINLLIQRISKEETLTALRGLEGQGSRLYFECFAGMFSERSGMCFEKRSRRPANDPINAALNFGYAFLANECVCALTASGLDTSIGFLHGIEYGRQSLALDVMEPFRSIVIDRLVLKIVNLMIIKEDDFIGTIENGFRFTTTGVRTFIEQYEKHMTNKDTRIRERVRDMSAALRHDIMKRSPWNIIVEE